MTDRTSQFLRTLLSAALMALAANCFLKYLWWTACYSAWYGIPKLADQWKAAGAHASFNGWSMILLEGLSITVLFGLIHLRDISISGFLKNGIRLAASLAITAIGTVLFALVLSWLKQGIG